MHFKIVLFFLVRCLFIRLPRLKHELKIPSSNLMVETVKLWVDQLKFEIGKCPFLLTDSITPAKDFLAHLSRRLIGELIVYKGIRRPSVRQHFQTTSPLKPRSRFFSYFAYP